MATKQRTTRKAPGKPQKPAPPVHTSFIVRSIHPHDRTALDDVKRRLGEATDSGAIGAMIRRFAREIAARQEAERERDELQGNVADLLGAMADEDEAIKTRHRAFKALDSVRNLVAGRKLSRF